MALSYFPFGLLGFLGSLSTGNVGAALVYLTSLSISVEIVEKYKTLDSLVEKLKAYFNFNSTTSKSCKR